MANALNVNELVKERCEIQNDEQIKEGQAPDISPCKQCGEWFLNLYGIKFDTKCGQTVPCLIQSCGKCLNK